MSITIEESATPWETLKYRNSTPGKTETHVSVSRAELGTCQPEESTIIAGSVGLKGSC
jgi:hypothetical protein